MFYWRYIRFYKVWRGWREVEDFCLYNVHTRILRLTVCCIFALKIQQIHRRFIFLYKYVASKSNYTWFNILFCCMYPKLFHINLHCIFSSNLNTARPSDLWKSNIIYFMKQLNGIYFLIVHWKYYDKLDMTLTLCTIR